MTRPEERILKDAYRQLADAAVLASQPRSVRDALEMIRKRRAGRPPSSEQVEAYLAENALQSEDVTKTAA